MTSRHRAGARSLLALALTLGLVGAATAPVSAVPTAPTDRTVVAGADPSFDMGPHLSRQLYIVLLTDLVDYPPVSLKAAEEGVQKAGDYWADQSRGYYHSFDVADIQVLEGSYPCSAMSNDRNLATAWDLAADRFWKVNFENSTNHLVVILPPGCNFRSSGKSTQGAGLGGNKVIVADLDLYTLVKHLGRNMSFTEERYAYELDGKLETVRGIPFGPMGESFVLTPSSVLHEYPPGTLDAASAVKHFGEKLGDVTNVGPGSSIDLAPVTGPGAYSRSAKFVDPVSGDQVWIEYRDGKRGDADAPYASSEVVADGPSPAFEERERCWAKYGDNAPECLRHHHFRPGVRVYHVDAAGTVTTIGLPRGYSSLATLTAGDMLVGPGGGYSVAVSAVSDASAAVHVRVGDGVGEWPELPDEPDEPELPDEPDEPGTPGDPDDPRPEDPSDPKDPVKPSPVTATVTTSAASSSYGTPATVAVRVEASASPTGEVTVSRGSKVLGRATLRKGAADVALPATLGVGTHKLTVRYGGSGTVAAAKAQVKVKVAKAKPRLTVKTTTAVRGKRATLRVTASSARVPKGRVAVFVDGTKVKTLRLKKGRATYRLPRNLKVGKHTVRVRYQGTSNFAKRGVKAKVRVWRSVATIKSFASGSKSIAAFGVYRDTVTLSRQGVLQRKDGKRWVNVKTVPKGRSTIKIHVGEAGSQRKFRVVVKNRGAHKGIVSKTLTLRTR